MSIAVTQTTTPWQLHNYYIELTRGEQNYREQNTRSLTADETLDTATGDLTIFSPSRALPAPVWVQH